MSGLLKTGTAAGALAIAFFCSPALGWDGLDEDVRECFQTVLELETGLDMDMAFPFEWEDYGVEIEFELIGFAFCNPPDPWAEPDTDPIGSLNAYGCDNLTGVDVTVPLDQDRAEVTIEITDLFLDFRTTRPGMFIPCHETAPVTADGWALVSISLTLGCQLERDGGCFRAIMDEEAVVVTTTVREIHTRDECASNPLWWPSIEGEFSSAIEDGVSTALDGRLRELMVDVNEMLCLVTPAVTTSWGGVKERF